MTLAHESRSRSSWLERLRGNTRARLLSGMLVLVPLVITVYILRFLYSFTAGLLAPLVKRGMGDVPHYWVVALSVAVFLGMLYLIGLVTAAVIGRRFIALAEAIIRRIPIVKSVYGASKQVVETLSFQEQSANFKSVVLIEFPHPGMLSVGFVTGRLNDEPRPYKVFIPTTPNITVGLFQLCPAQTVRHCDISIEEAIKLVVSGGILGPERLKVRRADIDVPEATVPAEDAAADSGD